MPPAKGKPKPKGSGAVPKVGAARKAAPKPKDPARTSPTPPPAPTPAPSSATTVRRERDQERSREKANTRREVGPPDHSRRDVARWEACRYDFELFCTTYLAGWFPLAFCGDHRKAIKKIEAAVLRGERFAFAMPRGSGKSTLCQAACLWALLYGHRRFVVLIGAEATAAAEALAELMEELEVNDALYDDFNEVCRYIRALEGIGQRANGQTADGERTRIEWTADFCRLPTIPGSPSSGSIIKVAGITGRIRGMKIRGKRPDLAIVDDPQTDESARSLTQVRTRERNMAMAVLGLAGPKVQIAALCPCTVIAPGDLADRVLDPARHPRWQGERFKMVYHFPLRADLWAEYARLLADVGGERAATKFYVAHRDEMDEGAVVAWPERFPEGKVSAIQHAMDLLIDNRAAFLAEAQNEPELDREDGDVVELDADTVAAKLNNLPRGVVPRDCNRLTAAIDVQGGCHFAVVTAWDSTFGGSVIDYLTYPKQTRPWFTNKDARPSLADVFPDLPEEARVYAGLKAIVEQILSRNYRQDGTGHALSVELCLIDSGKWTDTVYKFCELSPFRDRLRPSKGRGIKAGDKPMSEWTHDPRRDQKGDGWRIDADAPARGLVMYDTNHWKTFVATRLAAPVPVVGSLLLNGTDPAEHELLASHLTSEYQVETAGRGRELREWKLRPERNDNHWWDALVMSAVAASVRGLAWNTAAVAGDATTTTKPARRNLADLVAEKRAAAREGHRAAADGPTPSGKKNLAELVAEKRRRKPA